MTKNRLFFILGVTLSLVLGSLACSISGGVEVEGPLVTPGASEEQATPPARATPTAEAALPTEAPAEPTEPPTAEAAPTEAATTEPATEPVEVPAGEDPLAIADIPELEVTSLNPQGQGLGHLGTFRQRMVVSFDAEGSGYSGAYTYDADVNTADQAVHVTVSVEGAAAQEMPANSLQIIWIGTQAWFKIGNQLWLPMPESVEALPFDSQVFAAGSFLPYVQYFQRVEPDETVNGIPSVHYTYDADNLPTQYGTVTGQGHIYVALEGGYVVRYTFDGSGTFNGEEGFEGSGALHLAYDTYDVGAAIDIQAPRR